MWQAKLLSVGVDLSKTVDALSMTVELFHTDTRSTVKTYLLYLDEMLDTNLLTIKAKVQADLDRLAKLDDIRVKLESKIGLVI